MFIKLNSYDTNYDAQDVHSISTSVILRTKKWKSKQLLFERPEKKTQLKTCHKWSQLRRRMDYA
jgi:hypothetical protein